RPIRAENDNVGKGAADIDTDAECGGHLLGSLIQHCGIVPLDPGRLAPPARGPDLLTALLRRYQVDAPGRGVDDHAVVRACALGGEEFVSHVTQHSLGIALERIAPAAAAGENVTEHVALADRHRELRGNEPAVGIGIEIVFRWLAGTAAIEAEWPMVAPVRTDLQHPLALKETIVAPERDAAAKF